MLGFRHGLRGARYWRQVWSDHKLKNAPAREVYALAAQTYDAADTPDAAQYQKDATS